MDAALRSNESKARREYYNQPTLDGGDTQIIKWAGIRRSESFHIPQLYWKPDCRICMAFDPARTIDNSILTVMNIYEDPEMGLCGDIINCVSMIDTASRKGYKLDSGRQIAEIRQLLLDYNGNNPDYEYIDSLLVDQGSGGGGVSTYADALLADWSGRDGKVHRGLIDANHDIYAGYQRSYPNASDKLRLLSPRKYKSQMVREFIELFDLGVIRLPYEYGGNDYIQVIKKLANGEEESYTYDLNDEEKLALVLGPKGE